MLTLFFQSINWVDVGLAILFARIIFISVRTGFIPELFKFSGVIFALFVSLHYYAYLSAMVPQNISLPVESKNFLVFIGLWGLVIVVFKLACDGIMFLFKIEPAHQTVDKYAAGFLGAARVIFLSSLIIFALLLAGHKQVHRQVAASIGFRLAANAAPNTYSFLYHHLVSKLFVKEKFNAGVFAVVSRD